MNNLNKNGLTIEQQYQLETIKRESSKLSKQELLNKLIEALILYMEFDNQLLNLIVEKENERKKEGK